MTAVPRRHPEARELDDLAIARAVRGDRAAFQALVEHYQRAVCALVWRMLAGRGDAALVDDLVQETFVRVHGSLGRFVPDGPAKLSTWILTIATRVVLHHLRRRRIPFLPLARRAHAVEAPDRSDRGVERAELGAADEALVLVHADARVELRRLYLEATGDAAGADQLSPSAMYQEIVDKAAPGTLDVARRRMALERAGLAQPPADLRTLPPAEQAYRLFERLGHHFEELLADRLGRERASARVARALERLARDALRQQRLPGEVAVRNAVLRTRHTAKTDLAAHAQARASTLCAAHALHTTGCAPRRASPRSSPSPRGGPGSRRYGECISGAHEPSCPRGALGRVLQPRRWRRRRSA